MAAALVPVALMPTSHSTEFVPPPSVPRDSIPWLADVAFTRRRSSQWRSAVKYTIFIVFSVSDLSMTKTYISFLKSKFQGYPLEEVYVT